MSEAQTDEPDPIAQASSPTGWSADEYSRLIAEANALALYVARHGDTLPDDTGKALYDALLQAVANATSKCSADHWKALMKTYAEVTAVTYANRGVNGRTILDTQTKSRSSWRRLFAPRHRPVTIGVALFVFALVMEGLMSWIGRISDPGVLTGLQRFAYFSVGALSSFLVPAAWGGIGACVFLMKRLSDKLFDMAYEEARLRGDVTRIFLGAMFGVVIVVLVFPSFGEQIQLGEVNLMPATAAFVAGLGVKPVYAGFEAMSEGLASRLKGSSAGPPK